MAKLVTPSVEPISPTSLAQVTTITNTASNAHRNVTDGECDMIAFEIDNMYSASNSKMWMKLYDDASTSWTPGTTKPVLIIPCPAVTPAADSSTRGLGILIGYCIEGYWFEQGVSVAGAKADGDDATAAPDDPVNVNIIKRSHIASTPAAGMTALLTGVRTMSLGGSVETLRVLIGGSDNSADNDVTSLSGTTDSIHRVIINATQNPAEDVYVRFFDNATPTVGTTDAEFLLPCKRGRQYTWEFPRGVPFSTAISVATVSDAGATSGNTAPTGTVDVIVDVGVV